MQTTHYIKGIRPAVVDDCELAFCFHNEALPVRQTVTAGGYLQLTVDISRGEAKRLLSQLQAALERSV